MLRCGLALLALFVSTLASIAQQSSESESIIFQGKGPCTTRTFSIQDNWHVESTSDAGIKVEAVPIDGSPSTTLTDNAVPTSAAPSPPVSKGGTYRLTITSTGNWQVTIVESGFNKNLVMGGTQPSSPGPATSPITPSLTGTTELNPSPNVRASTSLTSTGVTSNTLSGTTTSAPIVKLTDDQARAVVLIKGDTGEGTGFLVKMPDGPVVVTNIHVIANNPHIKITTNTGTVIPMLSARGASDRDLALLSIKDEGFNYLTLCPDVSQIAQTGDEVVTPGNSLGGEVMLNTGGKVLGIGPQKVEIDNPIYHGNSGGPIFHTKSGQVIGVVTEGMKVNTGDALDKSSFANHNSAISGEMRYFGMRLDNVPSWIPIDWDRFMTETLFLAQFHDQSRRLDAFLNTPDAKRSQYAYLYIKDETIMKAYDTFHQIAKTEGRGPALKRLVFDLSGIVDNDMDQIQNPKNFYSFDQERAQHEIEYRKALKKELDTINDNADRVKGQSQ